MRRAARTAVKAGVSTATKTRPTAPVAVPKGLVGAVVHSARQGPYHARAVLAPVDVRESPGVIRRQGVTGVHRVTPGVRGLAVVPSKTLRVGGESATNYRAVRGNVLVRLDGRPPADKGGQERQEKLN